MAVTQVQQFLADKAQTPNDPEECCLAMGALYVDLGNNTCVLSNGEIDLVDACSYAQEVAELTPDAVNQQSGGGLGSWITSNAETVGTLIGGIGGLFGLGTPSPHSPTGLNEPAEDDGKKTLLAVAVAILVVVVAILLIRKSRK